MLKACKLNNKVMHSIRKEQVYQCVLLDLAMLGVVSKEECEMLLGGGIPDYLRLPNGETHVTSDNADTVSAEEE